MLNKLLFILLLCFALVPASIASSTTNTIKVALFIPGQSPFWTLVTNFMQEAAYDLGMKLRVYNADSNHFLMVKQVQEAISGPDKVDAIVFQNFKKRAPAIIKLAEENHVYAYLFNSPIHAEAELGQPREIYKYWIGEILPDDTGASEALTKYLIQEAEQNGKRTADGTVHLIGISGRYADTASLARIAGLKNAVDKSQNATLLQAFNTDWGKEEASQVCLRAMRRYPETAVVWSANYKTTNGILESLNKLQLVPGKDIFVNSFGLQEDILNKVISGEIAATTGGHYIESAWVMVQLYDYFNGVDFAEEGTSMRTPMPVITKNNAAIFAQYISGNKLSKENLKNIDFTRYSKALNPDLKKYEFNLESIFLQL